MFFPSAEPPRETAPWAITYGDLMTLLLTYFVMIVAVSDIHSHSGRFEQLRDSLNSRFGRGNDTTPIVASNRNVPLAIELQAARERREAWLRSGESPITETVAPTQSSDLPDFEMFLADEKGPLSPDHRAKLLRAVEAWRSRGAHIEVRAQVASVQGANRSDYEAQWDRAHERGRNILHFLVRECHVAPDQVQLAIVPSVAKDIAAGGALSPSPVQLFFRENSLPASTGLNPNGNLSLRSQRRRDERR